MITLVEFQSYESIDSATVCELVEKDTAYLNMQGRVLPLDKVNCIDISKVEVLKHQTDDIISAAMPLAASVKLAWIDVANSCAWLLVVLIFELEIILKKRGSLNRRRLIIFKSVKGVLYLTLLTDAILWTLYGSFLDSWDAYLWLLAFVLIDLNVLKIKRPVEVSAEQCSMGNSSVDQELTSTPAS